MTDGLEKENMIKNKINNMKSIITLFGVLIVGTIFGQECNKQTEPNWGEDENASKSAISLYSEPFKQKNYKEAKLFWWDAQKKAPKYKPILYSHGVYIYKDAIKREKDKEKKKGLSDTIFIIYDLWVQNFGDCYKIQLDRGTDLIKYKGTTNYEEAFNMINKGIEFCEPKKVKTKWINSSMLSAFYMVRNKKSDCDVLLNQYDKLSKICEVNIEQYSNNEKKKGYYIKTQEFLDQKVAPCASCDKLEELFKPKVESSPNDTALIKKAIKMLDGRKCNSSDFYIELATKIHTWSPSAESAISIGNYWYSQKKYKQALELYEEGLKLTQDESEKVKLYERIAQIELSKGSYKSAVSYARKMNDNCKANGIIARAIAMSATSCGNSKIEVSYVYCLAIDYANKAKGCVSSSTISAWKNRLANKSDLFLNEVTPGQSVKVPCWGENTTVRAID